MRHQPTKTPSEWEQVLDTSEGRHANERMFYHPFFQPRGKFQPEGFNTKPPLWVLYHIQPVFHIRTLEFSPPSRTQPVIYQPVDSNHRQAHIQPPLPDITGKSLMLAVRSIFEHRVLYVWYEERQKGIISLSHLFLAFEDLGS